MSRANSYQSAIARWQRLERAMAFPKECFDCIHVDRTLRQTHQISVIENGWCGIAIAMHMECAARRGRTRKRKS